MIGALRQVVARRLLGAGQRLDLAVRVRDGDARTGVGVLGLDDHLAREAGHLVELLAHRDAFDDVLELHDAADLGEDRHGERVPLGDQRARLDLLAFLHQQLGAVDDLVALALAARVVDDDELAVAVHDHQRAVLAA